MNGVEDTLTAQKIKPSNNKWKVVFIVNLFLGALLWFLFSTDYSLTGAIPDLLFPPLVALIGFFSLRYARYAPSTFKRVIAGLACLPGITGGCLFVVVGFLFSAVSFLWALFVIFEIAGERMIWQEISPDGLQVAELHFRGVGAYTGGWGRLYVRVKPRLFPWVERDLFYEKALFPEEYYSLYWKDSDTIVLRGPRGDGSGEYNKEEIEVGVVQSEMPDIFIIPVVIFQTMEDRWRERQIGAEVMRDVPVFRQGLITQEDTHYDDLNNVWSRFLQIRESELKDITNWYREELSRPPWSIVREVQYESRYCFVTDHQDDLGSSRRYFFEIVGFSDLSVHVIITTPESWVYDCTQNRNSP